MLHYHPSILMSFNSESYKNYVDKSINCKYDSIDVTLNKEQKKTTYIGFFKKIILLINIYIDVQILKHFQKQSPEVFYKKGVLENFTKFTVKHLRPATLLKKRLWHRCFPMNFVKFFRTPFLQNTSGGCLCTWYICRLV